MIANGVAISGGGNKIRKVEGWEYTQKIDAENLRALTFIALLTH